MALHALGAVDPTGLTDSRLQLHHAAQFVAAFGQNVIDARPDDSHRTMAWDEEAGRFVSEAGPDNLHAFVAPDPLSIGLVRDGEIVSSLRLMGTTLRTARAWMTKSMSEALGDPDFELEWPEYDMPGHFVVEGRPFQAKPGSMQELARWFSGAAKRLTQVVDDEPAAAPVRTWPHHFDIATLIVLATDSDGVASRSVGIGMSPGDDLINGLGGADTICAGPGNDVVTGGDGGDTITGGGGADTIDGGPGPDTISGQGGTDTITGGTGPDDIDGQGAADTIDGGPGADTIDGQNGADNIIGQGGTDTLRGQTGPDTIYGDNQDDQLFGGNGNDTLYGGPGFDKCAGNTGPNDAAEAATCEQTPGIETLF